ncbi:unnamed protein product [Protopolystoma xenopodis]|uniref:Uncharacterized protein n=1 Tax=Protopolystoma xenopodis TaxID=117903 RepID=A0A3S5A0G4_9PLAT|nr:unnamed protein product [Protopolystoma xenopodis]
MTSADPVTTTNSPSQTQSPSQSAQVSKDILPSLPLHMATDNVILATLQAEIARLAKENKLWQQRNEVNLYIRLSYRTYKHVISAYVPIPFAFYFPIVIHDYFVFTTRFLQLFSKHYFGPGGGDCLVDTISVCLC